eukprot:CCRYP_007290-RA/>CCRYP_007290-RA protein AED:0.15 eAED:-0.21 QI:0/-1/0/1/-1/1/1/0/276
MDHQSNECSSEESHDDAVFVSPSMEIAQNEFETFEKNYKTRFLPVVEKKTLGTYVDTWNPKKEPVLGIGKLIRKGNGLPSEKNHADYIHAKGKYDTVKYMQDHKEILFGTRKGFTGTYAPHTSADVDCESFFSQTGHAAHPNRNRTVAETFDHLVIGKHCISRVYCSQNKVEKEFLERWNKNAWSKKQYRDDDEHMQNMIKHNVLAQSKFFYMECFVVFLLDFWSEEFGFGMSMRGLVRLPSNWDWKSLVRTFNIVVQASNFPWLKYHDIEGIEAD